MRHAQPQPQALAHGSAQYLTFLLAGEEYAVPILKVREIIEYDVVTKVPSAPPAIRGVFNLRGRVVPAVDLGVRFGLPPTEVTKRTCIVIVELVGDGPAVVLGVIADAVNQVVQLEAADIEPPPTFGTRVEGAFLLGLARVGRKFALLLDLDRVLGPGALLAEATSVAPGAAAPPADGLASPGGAP
jgi:purine-binding chemotaxis protein CheW